MSQNGCLVTVAIMALIVFAVVGLMILGAAQ